MKPYLVIEWHDTETTAVGWLCIWNFVKGSTDGGCRMHPTVTRQEVERLAEAMAYKHQAIGSTEMGGCKSGIAYDYKAPDARDVLRRFLYAILPYTANGTSVGGDLGTDYGFILSVFKEQGFTLPMSPAMKRNPAVQQGVKDFDALQTATYDGFGIHNMMAGYGTAYSLDEAWQVMVGKRGASVVIQGFGAVGSSAAYELHKLGYKVVGIADVNCLVYCKDGLDIPQIVKDRKPFGELNQEKFKPEYRVLSNTEWLAQECDVLIPAALEDVITEKNVEQIRAKLIVEAANIPVTPAADNILMKKGIAVSPDFIANEGTVRYFHEVIFGHIPADAEIAVRDMEKCVRANTRMVFEDAKKNNRYTRDSAREIFKPKVQGPPEIK